MTEEIPAGQRAMTAAYERTNAWIAEGGHRFRDRFKGAGLGNVERAVVVVGNLHYQVENGGLFQYVDNAFADEADASGRTAAAAAAAVCALHADLDPEVAGVLGELALHAVGRPAERARSWFDEDGGEDPAAAAHWEAAREIEERFAEFGQQRRLAFIDAVALTHDEDVDPFALPVPAMPARRMPGDGPRHPSVSIALVGEDGNAYSIIARARAAMRRAKVPDAEIEEFTREAKSGDYDHVLTTVQDWVACDVEPAAAPRF